MIMNLSTTIFNHPTNLHQYTPYQFPETNPDKLSKILTNKPIIMHDLKIPKVFKKIVQYGN